MNERTHNFGLLALALVVGSLLVGCDKTVVVKPLNVAADYPAKFECKRADGTSGAELKRPALPPEIVATPGNVANSTSPEWLARMRERELIVATYLLALEAVNFACWDNMQWQREFYSKLPKD